MIIFELNQSSDDSKTETANQISEEIWHFARHLMRTLIGRKLTEIKKRIKQEIKSVHIGYSD